MFSALAPITDIAGPTPTGPSQKPEVGGLLFDHLVGGGKFVPAAFAIWQRRGNSLASVNKNMVDAIDGKRPVNRAPREFLSPLKRGSFGR